ncbi:MAG: hypothetical protein IPO86_10115 [Saprospiraceae bacterium]|nr:hypothetical protein [Saprospiraceae bacterium]
MNSVSVQQDHQSDLLSSVQKSNKTINLAFIILDTFPLSFLLMPFLNFKLSRAYQNALAYLEDINNSIPVLSDDELKSIYPKLENLNERFANLHEFANESAHVPQKLKKLIEKLHNKSRLVLEMVDIILDNSLIDELNEAIAEVKS